MIDIRKTSTAEETYPTIVSCTEEAMWADEFEKIQIITSAQELSIFTHATEGSFKGAKIPYNDDNAWLYGRLYDLAVDANSIAYKFSPLDMVEEIWYYEFSEANFFNWHSELGSPPYSTRKLGMVVNLSHSDEYRGGEHIFHNGLEMSIPRSRGTITIYPGYIINKIEPITSGKRRLLVAWFGGTNFK